MEIDDATHNIAKGKRTKRLRLLSPTTFMITSSCSSANSAASSTTHDESTDQEEEDMANCLILLAQGGSKRANSHHHHHEPQTQEDNHNHDDDDDEHGNKTERGSRGFADILTETVNSNTKVGFYIYECKTCNRTFPSFQALGGHRASHKKPKIMSEQRKLQPLSSPLLSPPSSSLLPSSSSQLPHLVVANYDKFEECQIKSVPAISLQIGNHGHRGLPGNSNKAKIHECSICGSEFTSGQALGGHMRRHRASTNTNDTTSCSSLVAAASATTTIDAATHTRRQNILQLDLNLPAPEDDLREAKFQFAASQKSMVLAGAPALVDCHY
ncbi:hypothetical protein RJT34_29807 [Clitoria ternatea]|uniref:C2H2-type domain-containing protein n=1 Tax=Clitoria ternatea TaxID=43366 RepID=A0AAN9ER97_CLITE